MPILGKVGLVNRGNYSSSATYNALDFLYYDGSTYVCLKNGVKGVTPSADGTNWQYLAKGFISDTSVFIKKSEIKDAFNVTTAGTYVADAHALKTLKDTADGYASRISTLEGQKYTGTSPIVVSNDRKISLGASGVTVKAYGDTANKSPNFGGSFSVPGFTVDSYGRLTAANAHNVTIPSIDLATSTPGTLSWKTTFTRQDFGSYVRRIGKFGILNINFTSTQSSGNGLLELANFPAGFIPASNTSITVPDNIGKGAVCISIFTDGNIKMMDYPGGKDSNGHDNGLRVVMPYFIA